MKQYVVDTHALLWYLSADKRIGSNAKDIIQRCENGEVFIVVPSIVLVESIEIINKKRIVYSIDNLLKYFEENPQFSISVLDQNIINSYKDYKCPDPSVNLESHDKIIIITSLIFDTAPILTKDGKIQKVHSTIW